MDLKCPFCGHPNIRPSKIRFSDIPYLFCFLRPIRCRSCYERYYLSIFGVRAIRAKIRAQQIRQHTDGQHPDS